MAAQNPDSGELEATGIPDFDPEGDAGRRDGTGSDSGDGEEDDAGTEHYVAVGPSSLRQRQPVPLGPRYRGSRVSRTALEEDSDGSDPEGDGGSEPGESGEGSSGIGEGDSASGFDDPEATDLGLGEDLDQDEEIDSDEAFGESDAEKFKGFTFPGSAKAAAGRRKQSKRPVAPDFLTEGDEEEEEEEGGTESGGEEDADHGFGGLNEEHSEDDDDTAESLSDGEPDGGTSDELDDDEPDGGAGGGHDAERAELKRMMVQGPRRMVDTLSQAAKADAEKGLAVRQQRKAMDSLLNVRIRLQKALVAANSLSVAVDGPSVAEESYMAAEQAAVRLLATLVTINDSMEHAQGKMTAEPKRKRTIRSDMPSQEIWDILEAGEDGATAKRRKVLDKWSARVSETAAQPTVRKLGTTPRPQSLVSVLDEQLSSMDRLVKRTRTPRSCAPVQAARKVTEDAGIYDDADFYQLLLKELVDQRASDPSAPAGGGGAGVPTTVSWAALKEARTRKEVDRKASKGRKLRFSVHEKLQNFMAPEDRRTWEPDAVDRFFRALFGRRTAIESEEGRDGSDEEGVHAGTTAGLGLRLFGS